MCEKSRSEKQLVDIILGWSIDEITNQDFLTNKVKSIPKQFSSVGEYLKAFQYPLIEETRADLSAHILCISEAPYVGIIVESCHAAESIHDCGTIFSFSLYCAEQRGQFEPKIGDIVLLSTVVPKDFENLQNSIELSCLAVVNEIGSGDGKHYKGKLGKFGSKEITGGGSSYVAIYLMNVTDISNTWNSLNVDNNDPHINLDLIKKALCYESLVNESCTCSSFQIEDVLHEKIIHKLNESQIGAICSSVSAIICTHSVSLHAICGLPGTGKTETASIIALAASSLKLKVVICLPDKYPVRDFASRIVKIVDGSLVVHVDPLNYTGDHDATSSDNQNRQYDILRISIDIQNHRTEALCLERSPLICCSISRLRSLKGIGQVDVLIMDNAFQIKECDSIVPLQLKGLRHVILVGNDYELPTTTTRKIAKDVGFSRSLFERLGSLCPPKKLLDIQYRMHPGISCFPNKSTFNGRLLDGPNVMDQSHFKCQLPEHIYKAYSFIDVTDGKEVMNDHVDDWKNVVEAAVVIKILMKLFHSHVTSGGRLSIGVISHYAAQVQIIQDMLSDKIKSNTEFSLWVRTSDNIQSCEVDVIIISTVRCNTSGSVGILSDQYLASVSLTRARHCLWIVGNGPTLLKSQSIWQDLVLDAMERKCLFNAGEDKDLSRVILDVKHELDELNDLLNPDSVLFNDKMWKVIFSDNFKLSFVALKSLFIKQIVIGFLLRLASGWRPKRRSNCSSKPSLRNYVKLYKLHGLYLVCTTEIVSDSKFIQVLKVWDVLPLVEIPKLMDKLEEMISLCSDYYKERCMKEKHEGNLVVPISWNICSDFLKYNCTQSLHGCTSVSKKSSSLVSSKISESLLLMKFYSLSSVSLKALLHAYDGREIELPFEVSDTELEIIKFPRSAFILGRSGTGKTIVSILKLMQREQDYMDSLHGIVPSNYSYHNQRWLNHSVGENGLRQIFVTVSANLCSAVKGYITRLRRCLHGLEIQEDLYDDEMREVGDSLSMFTDIPDNFIDIPQRHFPLVISLHKFLLMLDGSLSCSYFDRFHDLMMISDGERSTMTHAKLQLVRGKEVRFERFLTSYWPTFNAKFTRKLDPVIVFTQIISFIKGGCRLGKADQHEKMDEKDYINLSDSRMSTAIGKEKRQMIYKIFIDYEKKKQFDGEYDISDLVIDIHQRLRVEGYGGVMMDFVYIDEVQDFALNQLSLLKHISSNIKEGFVFSGDTAQTITKGVDFRFEDIRSLFYTDFLHGPENVGDLFRLNQNFRTHSAILKLAQSVLTLLYHFFPYSFDKLEAESSILQGEIPVLLESCDDNVLKNIFSSNQSNKDGLITFGAQQVILVRDDLVKKEVIDQVGNNALVLTVIECKGLEFQDVLLYNFFEKSPLENKWRVVYNFMAHKNLLDSFSLQYPDFDKELHSTLCGELKALYVAITRTRQRLWIFEKTFHAQPLFDYWKKLGVVKQGKIDSFAGSMQVFCKPEEWNLSGQKFFNGGNYESASFCFKRSGDVYRWKWAKAASLQMKGEDRWHTDFETASIWLSKAAEIYEEIEKSELAATCFMKLGNYEKADFETASIWLSKAAEIYEEIEKYELAATCFMKLGNYEKADFETASIWLSKAAEIYEEIEKYELAATCFMKLGNYEKAAEIYLEKFNEPRFEDAGDCLSLAGCWSDAAKTYAQGKCLSKCLSACKQGDLYELGWILLENWPGGALTDDKLKFMNSWISKINKITNIELLVDIARAFPEDAYSFLLEKGNHIEATRFQRMKGNILEEADVFERAEEYDKSSELVVFHIAGQLLLTDKRKGRLIQLSHSLENLRKKAKELAYKVSNFCGKNVSAELDFLLDPSCELSKTLAHFAKAHNLSNTTMETLAARNILNVYLKLDVSRFHHDSDAVFKWRSLHLERIIFEGHFSAQVLINAWNTWKERISNLFTYLQGSVNTREYENCTDLCQKCFGVLKLYDRDVYVAFNTKASWLVGANEKALHWIDNKVYMSGRVFRSLAQQFLRKEVSYLCGKLLGILMQLQKKYQEKRLFFVQRAVLGLQIFGIWKFLAKYGNKSLMSFDLSEGFTGMALSPLCYTESMIFSTNYSDFQDKDTAMRAVGLVLYANIISFESGSSPIKVGWALVFLFLSSKLINELTWDIQHKYGFNYPWKNFFDNLAGFKEQGFQNASSLACTFLDTLQLVDPHNQLLLIESLLFLTSSCQIGRGYFMTTTLMLSRAVSSEDSESYHFALSGSLRQADVSQSLRHMYDFILAVVFEVLSRRRFAWAKQCETSMLHFHQSLVLRLVSILGLVCLNSDEHFFQVQEVLRNAAGVLLLLPPCFQFGLLNVLKGKMRSYKIFAYLFSKALETIDNRLVLFRKGDTGELFPYLKLKVIDYTLENYFLI